MNEKGGEGCRRTGDMKGEGRKEHWASELRLRGTSRSGPNPNGQARSPSAIKAHEDIMVPG